MMCELLLFCVVSQEGQHGEQKFEIPSRVKDVNGTLHFSNVTAEDKGRYMCVATNSQGIINATVDIDVIGASLSGSMILTSSAHTYVKMCASLSLFICYQVIPANFSTDQPSDQLTVIDHLL
jgi:hypothetical protein